MIAEDISASEICEEHCGLNTKTVQTWKDKKIRGEPFKKNRGRPEALDNEAFCKFEEAHDGTKTLPELKA